MPGIFTCRVASHGGVPEEIRNARFEVTSAKGANSSGYIRSGPARGSSYTLHVDDLVNCRKARKRRRR